MDDRTTRYQAALQEYQQVRGVEPDRSWQAMLKLITAIPELWQRVEPHMDYRNDEPGLGKVSKKGLSDSEEVLLELARHLFNWQVERIDLSDLLDLLDDDLWFVVLEAMALYRKGFWKENSYERRS